MEERIGDKMAITKNENEMAYEASDERGKSRPKNETLSGAMAV